MSEWQPIETAPYGTEIMTYRKAGLMAVASRDEKHNSKVWLVSDGMYILDVTHWMPLPDAPK